MAVSYGFKPSTRSNRTRADGRHADVRMDVRPSGRVVERQKKWPVALLLYTGTPPAPGSTAEGPW